MGSKSWRIIALLKGSEKSIVIIDGCVESITRDMSLNHVIKRTAIIVGVELPDDVSI